MEDKPHHHVANGINDPAANYSLGSTLAHWLGAIAVLILYLARREEALGIPNSIQWLLAIPLMALVIYRLSAGFPRPANQHPLFNLLSRLALIAMLLLVFAISVSGLVLPFFAGEPYQILEFASWTAPYAGNPQIFNILSAFHEASWRLMPLIIGLFLLSFAKQFFLNRSGIHWGRLMPVKGGK